MVQTNPNHWLTGIPQDTTGMVSYIPGGIMNLTPEGVNKYQATFEVAQQYRDQYRHKYRDFKPRFSRRSLDEFYVREYIADEERAIPSHWSFVNPRKNQKIDVRPADNGGVVIEYVKDGALLATDTSVTSLEEYAKILPNLVSASRDWDFSIEKGSFSLKKGETVVPADVQTHPELPVISTKFLAKIEHPKLTSFSLDDHSAKWGDPHMENGQRIEFSNLFLKDTYLKKSSGRREFFYEIGRRDLDQKIRLDWDEASNTYHISFLKNGHIIAKGEDVTEKQLPLLMPSLIQVAHAKKFPIKDGRLDFKARPNEEQIKTQTTRSLQTESAISALENIVEECDRIATNSDQQLLRIKASGYIRFDLPRIQSKELETERLEKSRSLSPEEYITYLKGEHSSKMEQYSQLRDNLDSAVKNAKDSFEIMRIMGWTPKTIEEFFADSSLGPGHDNEAYKKERIARAMGIDVNEVNSFLGGNMSDRYEERKDPSPSSVPVTPSNSNSPPSDPNQVNIGSLFPSNNTTSMGNNSPQTDISPHFDESSHVSEPLTENTKTSPTKKLNEGVNVMDDGTLMIHVPKWALMPPPKKDKKGNIIPWTEEEQKKIDEIKPMDVVVSKEDLAKPIPGHKGWTPLHYASFFNQEGISAYLIEHGADPTAKTSAEYGACLTPAEVIVYNSKLETYFKGQSPREGTRGYRLNFRSANRRIPLGKKLDNLNNLVERLDIQQDNVNDYNFKMKNNATTSNISITGGSMMKDELGRTRFDSDTQGAKIQFPGGAVYYVEKLEGDRFKVYDAFGRTNNKTYSPTFIAEAIKKKTKALDRAARNEMVSPPQIPDRLPSMDGKIGASLYQAKVTTL